MKARSVLRAALRGLVPALALALAGVAPLGAQEPAAGDTLRLGALQAEAVRLDPRGEQLALLEAQSALRQRTLDAERLPALSVLGQGQYQSDVVSIPFALPGGATPPTPHRDSYDAHLAVRQRLHDPSLEARRALERARLAESRASVGTTLYGVRESVEEAFFSILLLRARSAELATGLADLEARLRLAAERVAAGAALPSETAELEAELLRRRQALDELEAGEAAARRVLGELTGRELPAAAVLAVPETGAAVARARATLDGVRSRPEYERFARSRELLDRQGEVVAAEERPRVSAFGRAGYGRPGLNPLTSEFDRYWIAGVQVEWAPWSWGSNQRDRESLALQREIVASEEAAFTAALRRGVASHLVDIDGLDRALAGDDAIIALRERILAETALRHEEGVVTSAEYVDRETDLLEARLARAAHRVELARSRARFLTLIGIEVP